MGIDDTLTTPAVPPGPRDRPPRPPGPQRRWGRLLLLLLAGLLLLLALAAGSALLFWRSDSGMRWLLAQVPGVTFTGVRGRPDGGPFEAAQVEWQSGGTRVQVQGLRWRDLQWRWRPYPGAWLRIELTAPQARQVIVTTSDDGKAKSGSAPLQAPKDLQLPLEVVVHALQIDRLQVNALPTVSGLQSDFHLGDERGTQHRVQRLQAVLDTLQASAQADVHAVGDMALQAQLTVATREGAAGGATPASSAASVSASAPASASASATATATATATAPAWPAWQLQAKAGGSLNKVEVQAALTATAVAAQQPARADVQATLLPFATWPLGALRATASNLDLSALQPTLPGTRLGGSVVVSSQSASAPISAQLDIRNDAPGAWSSGRLPLRSLRGTVQGSLADRSTLDVTALQVQLAGSSTADAGRLEGSGRWQGQALSMDVVLQALRPAQLHTSLPAMTLDGPLKLSLQGLPSPGPAATSASAAASGADGISGDVHAQIAGRLDAAAVPRLAGRQAGVGSPGRQAGVGSLGRQAGVGSPGRQAGVGPSSRTAAARPAAAAPGGARGAIPVQLLADASFALPADGTLRAAVQRLQLSAGAARANASATVTRDGQQLWAVRTQGDISRFDPALWWLGAEGSRWRRGPHLLNGRWDADLQLPASALATAAATPASSATGRAAGATNGSAMNSSATNGSAANRSTTTPPTFDPRAPLQALRGKADVALHDSQLAGVPLQLTLALQAAADAATLRGDVQAAHNRASVNLRVAAGSGADRGQAEIDAPALVALAPLADLLPGAATWWPQGGSLSAKASAQGRWPAVQTQGEAHASGLGTTAWHVGQADARWSAATGSADAPLQLSLTASALTQGQQRIDTIEATLDGSLRAHRLQLRAASPVRPPAWVDAAPAVAAAAPASQTAPNGTSLLLDLRGGWEPAGATAANAPTRGRAGGRGAAPAVGDSARPATAANPANVTNANSANSANSANAASPAAVDPALAAVRGPGGTWRGRLVQLQLAPRRGDTTPWVAARDLAASVAFDSQGGVQRALAAPGSIELLGATLRWTDAAYDAAPANANASSSPQLRLNATLDPLAVAPWLARLQPTAGWGGDLRVAASVQLRSTDRFDADVLLQRTGGDLTIVRDGRSRPLGLSNLRLALAAHNGNWQLTQALAGSEVGVLAGAQTVRTTPAALVPAADAALQGTLDLRMADLDVWSNWLPAGWRVGGTLRANATLSGTVGAPEYSGRITGDTLSVGNLLEGIDLTGGVLDVALRRTDARIERFSFKAGAGTLDVAGGATFGAAPTVQLRIKADHFQALGRADRRVVVSGNATVAMQGPAVTVAGKLGIDEGLIDITQADAPKLDDDVLVFNRPGAPPPKPGAAVVADASKTAEAPNLQVALTVDLGRNLRLRGRGLQTALTGELRVSTPGGKLAVNGVVRTEGGTYTAYGQNLAIERGIIAFTGEVTSPRLDVLAIRADVDTRVGVTILGSALDPRVRLYSDPDMSELDKLSWLVMGRASDGLGRADTALLQQAALAVLAGDKANTGGFVKKLGLDQLSVGQTGSGDARDTVVTLGKQISSRLFIGYERGLNATNGSWQLIYRIAQRLTLRAQSGDASAVDLIWTWRWD